MYFVIDSMESSKIILYIGETNSANKRWKGEHDCKNYLMNYKEEKNCKLVRAEVKKDNESSNKLFKSCGFIFIEHVSGMNTYELSI